MKILTIGVLAFFAWLAFATYFYVCRIKGLCNEPVSLRIDKMESEEAIVTETTQTPPAKEQKAAPKDLIIYFAFDKSEFTSNDNAVNYFNESNDYLNQDTRATLRITGHTDAIGTKDYNQSLGYKRAQSVLHFFESKGIKEDKIVVLSMGESEPADNNTSTEGRANNRRTVITIKK